MMPKPQTPNAPDAEASLERKLLDIMRGLNLAVAVIADARESCIKDPAAKPSAKLHDAMVHLQCVLVQLEAVQKQLARPA
jgi:hypothetical protein